MAKASARKRIYLINRDFQFRYVRQAIVVALVTTVLTACVLLFPLFQFRILRTANFVPLPFMLAMVFAALVNFSIIGFFGVLMTHKIVGPMYGLVRNMRMLATGDFNCHLKVREGDELKYVVRNFNELVDEMAMTTNADLQQLDQIDAALQGGAGEQTEARKLLAQLRGEFARRLGKEEGGAAPATKDDGDDA